MAGFSDYYENTIINHLLRNQAFTPPATIYVALFTTAPADDGTGSVEVSGGAYARQTVTLSAAALGATSNSADITYPTATANWGTVVAAGLFDALTVGNLLAWANLAASKVVNSGDVFKFLTGDLDFTVD